MTITVTNEDEPGRVTFWRDGADATTAAIVVGDELDGAVDDSDGNPNDPFPIAMYKRIAEANVTSWQWAKSRTPDMMDSWMNITGATAAAYTVIDDDDEYYLRATAMYSDGEGMGKTASEKTMMVTMNATPMFESETDIREVAENTAADQDIGPPVEATDADNDALTYALSGTDAASFDIDDTTGQLKTKAALDYETKRSYDVTVTATDEEGLSDAIMVTINITGVDEEPTVAGDATIDYAENGTGDVATFTATDPEEATISWSLEGTDADVFDISTAGVLTFKESPDYEMPADADTGNAYEVTVVASDGTNEDRLDVTITVTDVDDLVDRYDTDDSSDIDKAEVLKAINDYLFGEGDEAISKSDVLRLINLYLFGDE